MKVKDGFRPNVGMIPLNTVTGKALVGKRKKKDDFWQFPQGGIDAGENEEQALYRELFEETGLTKSEVEILAISKGTFLYYTPKRYRKHESIIGQQQRWYLLRLNRILVSGPVVDNDEFVAWDYIDPMEAPRLVIPFKRRLYKQVLKEFKSFLPTK